MRLSIRLGNIHILIIGNFNHPKVNCAEHTYSGDDNSNEAWFFKLIEDLGLYQGVKSATPWRSSWTPSRPDSVLINEGFLIENLSILGPPVYERLQCLTSTVIPNIWKCHLCRSVYSRRTGKPNRQLMWMLIGISYCARSYILLHSLSCKRLPKITGGRQSVRTPLFESLGSQGHTGRDIIKLVTTVHIGSSNKQGVIATGLLGLMVFNIKKI